MSALDTQVGGSHYKTMPIQPMEFSMANNMDACQHTIIKYVARFREKGGIQDLEKAKHVIDMLIEFEGRAQQSAKVVAFPTQVVTEPKKEQAAKVVAFPTQVVTEPKECGCVLCVIERQASAKFQKRA